MPTAAELLAGSNSTDSSASGNRCIISEDLRTISIPQGQEILGVYSDADVRRVYFDMPAECDGVDLTDFDIFVNYRNANGKTERYPVDDAADSEGVISFSWLVARKAFEAAGEVTFNVCLMEYAQDGETVTREFNTTLATMTVLEGLEAAASVMSPYSDAVNKKILQWESRVSTAVSNSETATTSANTAADNANDKATLANDAAAAATSAAAAANAAADRANSAADLHIGYDTVGDTMYVSLFEEVEE